jgi:hypothetical protein
LLKVARDAPLGDIYIGFDSSNEIDFSEIFDADASE